MLWLERGAGADEAVGRDQRGAGAGPLRLRALGVADLRVGERRGLGDGRLAGQRLGVRLLAVVEIEGRQRAGDLIGLGEAGVRVLRDRPCDRERAARPAGRGSPARGRRSRRSPGVCRRRRAGRDRSFRRARRSRACRAARSPTARCSRPAAHRRHRRRPSWPAPADRSESRRVLSGLLIAGSPEEARAPGA